MPEQISRFKIADSPLHRGSSHGSPAFRKKKLQLNKCKISDGKMSPPGLTSTEVIARPPRSKRNVPILVNVQEENNKNSTITNSENGIDSKPRIVQVQQKAPVKHPPTKPPKPPNIPTTSRVASNFTNGTRYGKTRRAPQPPLPPQNNENGEHIYESIEAGKTVNCSAAVNSLRHSAEIQAWPWAAAAAQLQKQGERLPVSRMPLPVSSSRQASLPPNSELRSTTLTSPNFINNLRSVSLGRGTEATTINNNNNNNNKPSLFQRFNSLRRSFNSRERLRSATASTNRGPIQVQPNNNQTSAGINSTKRRPDDPDWVFFRGFSGKRREDMEPYSVGHGPLLTVAASEAARPTAPPRRKRPQRILSSSTANDEAKPPLPLRRSLSFTDAHFIAQAVYEGDTKLIEELYPDFPRSEPIYAVVDKSAKTRKSGSVHAKSAVPLPVHQEASDEDSKTSARSYSSSIGSCNGNGSYAQAGQQRMDSGNAGSHAQKSVQDVQNIQTTNAGEVMNLELKQQNCQDKSKNYSNSVEEATANDANEKQNGANCKSRMTKTSEPNQDKALLSQEEDRVTFNSSVMFVRQAESKSGILPDVVNESNDTLDSPRQVIRVNCDKNSHEEKSAKINPIQDLDDPNVQADLRDHWNAKSPVHNSSGVYIECGKTPPIVSSTKVLDSHYNQDNYDKVARLVRKQPPTFQSNVHPFAHRTQQRHHNRGHHNHHNNPLHHSSNKASTVSITNSSRIYNSPGSQIYQESLDDSFDRVLRSADQSLHQAESILVNLRRQKSKTLPAQSSLGLPPHLHGDSDSDSLGSDIESNIRKLERTQVKINAALEAFRTVKQQSDTATGSKPVMARSHHTMSSMSRVPHASTVKTTPYRRNLGRRHSFTNQSSNSNSDSNTSSQSNKSNVYEADIESAENSNAKSKDNNDWDSDAPAIKSKLKGLLGSFGKSGKTSGISPNQSQQGQQIAKAPLMTSISDPIPSNGSVSDYARRIEILAHDLSNGNAMNNNSSSSDKDVSAASNGRLGNVSPGGSSASGYYTPPSTGNGTLGTSGKKSLSSAESSQRNSVSSESDQSDSEEQQSGQASTTSSNNIVNNQNLDSTLEEKNKTKAFYVARELMTSEKVFVDVLRLLNVEFRDFVQKARRDSKSGLLPDTDFSRLFNNLPELQTLNEDLLQDFEDRIDNWSSLPKIADVIVRKGPFLKLYTTYIREFSAVNYHFDDCCTKFPKFAKIVKDFEKRDICRNLKLKHFMLKPVQRLPQYKLLLEDYLRHLAHDSLDFDDTTNALRIVSEAAEHANNTIRQGDKFRKMLQLQSRLGDYFELIRPGRDLIKEGELQKLSRKGVGTRYFILLSDCLLYTSYSGSWSGSDTTSLRVSYQIPLSTLQIRLPSSMQVSSNAEVDGEEMSTEFELTSPVRSFTVRANSVRERNAWLDAINTAIEDHASRKATFVVTSTTSTNGSSAGSGIECRIGVAPPVWVPDRRVTMCQKCAVEFTVLVRRHHCRSCGQVICSSCSSNKAPLRYLEFNSARVCDSCFEALERELGGIEMLRGRFKKRDTSRGPAARYVPERLKVSASGEGAQMTGYLRIKKKQKNNSNSKWKRYWFILKDRVLYAYKAPEDAVAVDTYPILGFSLETLSDKNFELYEGEMGGLVFQLAHPGSETLIFCADNDNVCEKWMSAISEAVKMEPNNHPTMLENYK